MISMWILLPMIFFISVIFTGLIRLYVIHKNMFDIPNNRSSHDEPTPRGGGVSIVLLFTCSTIWLYLQNLISLSLFYALNGGFIIAIIGWLDDIFIIHPLWRGVVHILVAIWAVYWIGGLANFPFSIGYPLAMISIIWCINLYNFMDGIDGLAATEGLCMSIVVAFILSLYGFSNMSLLCLLLAASIAGFLVWNWPPAKIFMGDVGSGYLGYVFAVLALSTANTHLLPLTFWMTISALFLCDATWTVLFRLWRGERLYEAHREHAYQRLVQNGISHFNVTISAAMINIFVLFPIAILMLYYPSLQFQLLSFLLAMLFVVWNSIRKTRA